MSNNKINKNDILLIGPATDFMLNKLADENAVFHRTAEMKDPIEWMKENGESIGYVMTNGKNGISSRYMELLPNLKLVSSHSVGYDKVDVNAAISRGVIVTHTPKVLDGETSTTAIMLILACYRDLSSCERFVRSGDWAVKGDYPLSRSLENSNVGLVGMGRIGQAIAKKLLAFGSNVVYHSRTPKTDLSYRYYDDLLSMARDVDCLVCIVPGGPDTKHLINRQVLDALGSRGTLINVARGSVVDQAAMIEALQEGRLGWAGLDVFENEPHVPKELCDMDNVVLLPHVGSATVETRAAMATLTVDNVMTHMRKGNALTPIPECKHLIQSE